MLVVRRRCVREAIFALRGTSHEISVSWGHVKTLASLPDSLARLCGSKSVYNLGSLHIATKLEHEVNRITRGCQYTAERQRQTIECCLDCFLSRILSRGIN